MRISKKMSLGMVLLFSGISFVFSANFPIGTYTVQGSARNYNYELLDENSGITLQLVATNGAIVAESAVFKPNSANYNFRLVVPMSTAPSKKAVQYGDKLNIVAKLDGTVVQASLSSIEVGAANSASVIDLAFATYSTPEQLVPDEYIEEYVAYIIANEKVTKGEYDPHADWDDDGFNNYSEYVAGTNPIDKSDKLKITAINFEAEDSKEYLALSFEYVGGRIYGVKAATELGGSVKLKTFSPEKGSSESKTWVSSTGDYGEKTIFMVPVAESPDKEFYYVVVNPEDSESSSK